MKKIVSFFCVLCLLFLAVPLMDIEATAIHFTKNGGGPMNNSDQSGLRFSLVDGNGNVKKIVDVLERRDLRDNVDDYYTGIRLYNQCKVDISRSGQIIQNDNLYDRIYTSSLGTEYEWSYAFKEDVFARVKDSNFSVALLDYANDRFFIKSNVYNYLKILRDSWLHGENKEDIFAVCDILKALGLDVYDGYEGRSTRPIYINIMNLFVIPEYTIIIEPVFYVRYTLWDVGVDESGNEICIDTGETVLYYGSTTELALVGINKAMNPDDLIGDYHYEFFVNGELQHRGMSDVNNWYLDMGTIFNCLGIKAAYVDDEYEEVLQQFNIVPVLDEDLDYVAWEGEIPDRVINYWAARGVFDKARMFHSEYSEIKSTGGTSYARYNNSNFITNHACGMSLINASDLIKPQVETFDYTYNVSTEVETSVKVSNRSKDSFVSLLGNTEVSAGTAVNENDVPYALIGEFIIDKVSYDNNTREFTATDVNGNLTYQAQEFGLDTGIYYAAFDGILGKKEILDNGFKDSYLSFNWKTPDKPCKITFRVEFQNANYFPEAVLGTDPDKRTILKGVNHPDNPTRDAEGTKIYSQNGTFYTTFICVVEDNFKKTVSDIEIPDTVAITSIPLVGDDRDERELYDTNIAFRDEYYAAVGSGVLSYDGRDFRGKEQVTLLEWTEYEAKYSGSDILLTAIRQKAETLLYNDEDAVLINRKGKILRTDHSGLYSTYSDKIGSGYGYGIDFYSYLTADERGRGYDRTVTVQGKDYPVTVATNYSHGAVFFPEFLYKNYYGELVPVEASPVAGRDILARYCFVENENSVYYGNTDNPDKSRVHFIPAWYPDGEYQVGMSMFDAWTPAGQLWFYEIYSIDISGSLYDTWYASRTQYNQRRS